MTKGKTIRVLVADDSALMRKMITDILRAAHMDVVGVGRNGPDTIEMVRELRPDVITMDIEMPGMNGVDTLRHIMDEMPTPIVMLSSLTHSGAETTLVCLELGAVDFVHKPSGSISMNLETKCDEIVTKVRAAASVKVARVPKDSPLARPRSAPATPAIKPLPVAPRQERQGSESQSAVPTSVPNTAIVQQAEPKKRPPEVGRSAQKSCSRNLPIVVIASSTGGPSALSTLFADLPGDLNAAVYVVQHLPVGFSAALATRLNALGGLKVREAADGDRPEAGVALLAPAGKHMVFDSTGTIGLTDDPPLWGVRPAADVAMKTASTTFGSRVIGLVMTGMGRDGAHGSRAIKVRGGKCFAQDEATSAVFGMPKAAWEDGGIEKLVPLNECAQTIQKAVETYQDPVRHVA